MSFSALPRPDVVIAGAGIIGLSLALECSARGAKVLVIERDTALRQASFAAAGMLAANDPHNPPALFPLSQFSISLYPNFLESIETLSGQRIPLQTSRTIQYLEHGETNRLAEHSIDPRQLAAGLLSAIRAAGIELKEHTTVVRSESSSLGVVAYTNQGEQIHASQLVYATGAWADTDRLAALGIPLQPRKGQMLRVQMPTGSPLTEVHRSEHVYLVPRTAGPQAGTALIGATVEDAGFDTTVHPEQLAALRELAARLDPALSFARDAQQVEAWAGLRPATPDSLPCIGRLCDSREILASGHYRNGILLAPGTAQIVADLVEDIEPEIDLAPYSYERFSRKTPL